VDKTPFHRKMTETHGLDCLGKPYLKALEMLPEKLRELGPACRLECEGHHHEGALQVTGARGIS